MIRVKSLGAPPVGVHWSMGADYMARIGAADARKLCPGLMPRMGYERDVKVIRPPAWPHLPLILTLQNISGDYYLASPHARIDQWPEVFGVSVDTGHGRAAA